MRNGTKLWLVIAVCLILIGCFALAGVMTVLHWDFGRLSTNSYETNEYEIDEDYTNISIVTDTADITLVPCEGEQSTVVCYERENAKHAVTVRDGTLLIELNDTKQWYEHIGISFDTPKVTLYIPEGAYGALCIKLSTGDVTVPRDFQFESLDISASTGAVKNAASASGLMRIKTTTGHIRVENVSAGVLDLSVSTGRMTLADAMCAGKVTLTVSTGKAFLSDVTCQSLTSSGNTGDISLKNVIATETISIKRTTGDVELEDCDAAELCISTDTGDVQGSLLSEKVFIVHTRTGEFDVPKTTSGGKCEVTTSTGDIEFEIR